MNLRNIELEYNMDNEIIIKIEKQVDSKTWTDFVNDSVGSTFFSYSEYYTAQEAIVFYVVAYDKNNKIIGGIIGRIRGATFPGNIFSKSVWVESGIITRKFSSEDIRLLKIELLKALEMEAKNRKCIIIKFNHWCREEDQFVFNNNNIFIINNPTLINDLYKSENEMFSQLSKGHRATVKKAQKADFLLNISDRIETNELDDFYRLYESTQKRAINNHTNSSMTLRAKKTIQNLLESDSLACKIVTAYIEGELASALFLVEKAETVYYFLGASNLELNRKYGASNLVIWFSMLWAKNNGKQYFDFGGIPDTPPVDHPAYGVYKFKKNFGGQLINYLSGEKILSPLRAKIFNRIINNRKIIRLIFNIRNNR